MDRALGRADDLADTAKARQAATPDGIYWHGRRAVAVCRATRSTRLAASLRSVHAHLRDTWPRVPASRELGDELRTQV